ncbi:MAG: TonB-dependent receptor [Myxococcales bacterium]|nr:TonB-dependent receptor [Myxococcales bacterium]
MRSRFRFLPILTLLAPLMMSQHAFAQPADDPGEEEGETIVPTDDEDAPPEDAPPEDAPPAEDKKPEDKPSDTPAEDGGYDLEEYSEEEMGETDLTEKPKAGKGALTGTVRDTKYEEPLVEAQIEVVGKNIEVFTDVNGQFRLELPPGTYTLRIAYDAHYTQRLDNIIIADGKIAKLDIKLRPDEKAVETFVVETKADTSGLAGLTLTRQRSAAMGDSVGRGEISKTPDKDAAQAAQRVVGATIVDGRFVYVRGLGDRYANAQLNGAPLPSPEPDRQAVPLDLFPSVVLESLTIAKTFTPDKPGDFAGGSVRIKTRDLPEEFLFKASLGVGFNTQATFQDRLGYRGSNTDWLGFDGGTRQLPDIPDYKLSRTTRKPDGEFITQDELTANGRKINSFMTPQEKFTLPSHSGSVVVGKTWDLGGEQKLGLVGSLNYSRSWEVINDRIRRKFDYNDTEERLDLLADLHEQSGKEKVRWGAFGTLTYQLSRNHKITLTGLRSQSSDDTARILEGFYETRQAVLHGTRLQFISRVLNFGQLQGEHTFEDANRGLLEWNVSLAKAFREEPDTRDTVYRGQPDGSVVYIDGSESGSHFYADQAETSIGAGVDYTQPLSEDQESAKVKFGGLVSTRDREFDSRRFAFRRRPGSPDDSFVCESWRLDCADKLFTQDNIGDVIQLDETTFDNDAYTAGLDIYAVYVMSDTAITDWFRVIVGERIEVTRQNISSFDPFSPDDRAVEVNLKSTDMLPSLGLVFDTSKKTKVRFSATRTLARPQLRELAPFTFTNYFGGYSEAGNPDLTLTKITNLDARFEWYPTLEEIVAASVFYKYFKDPIEQTVQSTGDDGLYTYQNSASAKLVGFEIEGRKGLGFISKSLSEFSAVANATIGISQVELAGDADFSTSRERPLSNQPPFTINAALDYSSESTGIKARLLYNVVAKQIVAVGFEGLPDIYQQPRHQLDFVIAKEFGKHFELKFSAANLLNSPFTRTQGEDDTGDNVMDEYTKGMDFSIGAGYTY